MNRVTAIILAGGVGSRLKSVFPCLPKSMAPINGKPFLSYIFDNLVDISITDAVLCTGFMADTIHDYYSNRYKSLNIIYSRENSSLGTGGAVLNSLCHVKTESLLILNGDSYVNTNLELFYKWHIELRSNFSILSVKVNDCSRYGTVKFDANNRLLSFCEKKASKNPAYINSGIYLTNKRTLDILSFSPPFSMEKDIIPSLINIGIFVYPIEAKFIDIGTPDSYADSKRFFGNE